MKSVLSAISGLASTAATSVDYTRAYETSQYLPPVSQLVADQGRIRFGAGFRLPVNRKID
jgi:hypothetical protein